MVHLIDGPGHVNNQFVEGNPFAAIEGTVLTAEWLNMLQLELRNVLTLAGLTATKGNNQQLQQAITLVIQGTIDLLLRRQLQTFAPYDIDDPGQPSVSAGVLVGGLFLATTQFVDEGQLFTGTRLGMFAFPRQSTETWTIGDRVYWNDTSKEVSVVSGSGLFPVGTVGISGGTGLTFGWTMLDAVHTSALP